MAEKKGYKPEVTVVRMSANYLDLWREDTGTHPDKERAYLVRGLPMPGERVRDERGVLYEVKGSASYVEMTNGDMACPEDLTPYDPEAEKVERVAKAIYFKANPCLLWNRRGSDAARYRDAARAAIKAMEAENG